MKQGFPPVFPSVSPTGRCWYQLFREGFNGANGQEEFFRADRNLTWKIELFGIEYSYLEGSSHLSG